MLWLSLGAARVVTRVTATSTDTVLFPDIKAGRTDTTAVAVKERKGWVVDLCSLPVVRHGYVPIADVLLAAVPLEFTSSSCFFRPART